MPDTTSIERDQHVDDALVALDGGQLHLDVDTAPCTCPPAWRAAGDVRGDCTHHGAGNYREVAP